MKAIARFILVLLLICGTALAWRSSDRRFRPYTADDSARAKEEGDPVQTILQAGGRRNAQAEPVWSKSDFQAKLEEAFQKNDPCAVRALLHTTSDAAPRDYWSAGMAVLLSQGRSSAPALEELLANSASPLYGEILENPTRVEMRFFNALAQSGQWRGMDESGDGPKRRAAKNLDKAIESFKSLAQEDPENGVYSYFLAGALRQAGANKDEVHAAFNQAAKAPKFDPFYQAIFDSLLRGAYGNAATFTWAYSFLELMPMPDFEVGIRYLKYWGSNEEPGKWIAHRIAKRLLELGSNYKSSSPGFQYSRSEYMLGQNLKLTMESRQEKSWEEYMNKMREAQQFISETPEEVRRAESVLYGERIQAKRSCSPDAWKDLFAAYQAKKAK